VITESFNRVVCEYLACELEPSSRQKTLIFCLNDAHARKVARACQRDFGSKITIDRIQAMETDAREIANLMYASYGAYDRRAIRAGECSRQFNE
jgi:type I site-specific restriction endonuclease